MQRQKGATYEREVARELTQALGTVVQRRLGQARDGGHDLTLPGFTPELKRRASIVIHGWLHQAEAAARDGNTPIVICRADGEDSLVVMLLTDWVELAREHIVNAASLDSDRHDAQASPTSRDSLADMSAASDNNG